MTRFAKLALFATLGVGSLAGCSDLLQNPNTAMTDPNYSTSDPAFAEVADNPATSPYYDEPSISYGFPGDGLSDMYDTSSTYLASVNYTPQSASKSDAVAMAVQ